MIEPRIEIVTAKTVIEIPQHIIDRHEKERAELRDLIGPEAMHRLEQAEQEAERKMLGL